MIKTLAPANFDDYSNEVAAKTQEMLIAYRRAD